MFLVVAGALVALMWKATADELARNPARDATAILGPYGPVTIRFTTRPSPPLPTGAVDVIFVPMDMRQRPVELDSVSYEYGVEADEEPLASGQALLAPDGSGAFRGTVRVPTVGDWWLRAKFRRGEAEATVRFTFRVAPAQ